MRSGGLWIGDEPVALLHPRLVRAEAGGDRRVERIAGAGGEAALPGVEVDDIGDRAAGGADGDQIGEDTLGQRRADRFDQHPDGAAAGQPDGEGLVVGDAEGQQPRPAVVERRQRLFHHRALDAAARDRAHDPRIARDGELAAHRPRAPIPRSRPPWPAPRARPPGASRARSRGSGRVGSRPFWSPLRSGVALRCRPSARRYLTRNAPTPIPPLVSWSRAAGPQSDPAGAGGGRRRRVRRAPEPQVPGRLGGQRYHWVTRSRARDKAKQPGARLPVAPPEACLWHDAGWRSGHPRPARAGQRGLAGIKRIARRSRAPPHGQALARLPLRLSRVGEGREADRGCFEAQPN